MDLKLLIRNIPDHPKPGINFKDITPLFLNPDAVQQACADMTAPFIGDSIDFVIGIESRGFLFGVQVAYNLKAGFIPIRKPGKLPGDTIKADYSLEYGTDSLEMHTGQFKQGANILIVDDLLATGGTVSAAAELVKREGGNLIGFSFLIELSFLNGRGKLEEKKVTSLISYDEE
ncbi:adenine phosphoribosyltransferase [Fibrobacterota bacterium]